MQEAGSFAWDMCWTPLLLLLLSGVLDLAKSMSGGRPRFSGLNSAVIVQHFREACQMYVYPQAAGAVVSAWWIQDFGWQVWLCCFAGVYFVPAFSGLLAPHWRDDARGALLGISSMTTRAHIVRAMLEAICWQVGFHCPA